MTEQTDTTTKMGTDDVAPRDEVRVVKYIVQPVVVVVRANGDVDEMPMNRFAKKPRELQSWVDGLHTELEQLQDEVDAGA
ncbi:hypothetical protein [Pseudoclavibacter helvolus]|uniref:Uncharacterized protein n=1 Tax=Pseudoclavibacter helvolus TaxID=255205 RepID=A0A7W4YFK5_9MICO|nr:hypothetical protein [Pseudoclavibacter helvolus]MBB2956960.1 hypothetical protein [Pseudoclavibacter helvolus]